MRLDLLTPPQQLSLIDALDMQRVHYLLNLLIRWDGGLVFIVKRVPPDGSHSRQITRDVGDVEHRKMDTTVIVDHEHPF